MTSPRRSLALLAIGIAITFVVTVFIWHTKAQTVINPGYDQFTTPSNATSSETLSLPAGAIHDEGGYPSEEFSGNVTFEGGAAVSGYSGDTVIERTQSVTVPGSTPLQVIGLNLVSVGTITINFTDSTSANYSVGVSQSPSTASTGTMNFASGGTFTNSLNVNVEYTFTATGEPTATFDAAPNGIAAIPFSSSGTWTAEGSGSDVTFRKKLGDDLSARSNSGGTGGAGIGGSGATAGDTTGAAGSTGGVNAVIVPQTETAALASHGILPPGGCGGNQLGDEAASPDIVRCENTSGVVKGNPKK